MGGEKTNAANTTPATTKRLSIVRTLSRILIWLCSAKSQIHGTARGISGSIWRAGLQPGRSQDNLNWL